MNQLEVRHRAALPGIMNGERQLGGLPGLERSWRPVHIHVIFGGFRNLVGQLHAAAPAQTGSVLAHVRIHGADPDLVLRP